MLKKRAASMSLSTYALTLHVRRVPVAFAGRQHRGGPWTASQSPLTAPGLDRHPPDARRGLVGFAGDLLLRGGGALGEEG
jgi:hypothetical protein